MSAGYPLEMGVLLLAMKAAVRNATTGLHYLNDARIRSGPWYVQPWNAWTIYFQPLGSPETVVAEGGSLDMKYATHQVMIDLVKLIDDPSDEGEVVGRTESKIGITTAVSEVLAFFENNALGLTKGLGLEMGFPPTIECPGNGYTVVEADTDIWIQSARMLYQAPTRPFVRTGT